MKFKEAEKAKSYITDEWQYIKQSHKLENTFTYFEFEEKTINLTQNVGNKLIMPSRCSLQAKQNL